MSGFLCDMITDKELGSNAALINIKQGEASEISRGGGCQKSLKINMGGSGIFLSKNGGEAKFLGFLMELCIYY